MLAESSAEVLVRSQLASIVGSILLAWLVQSAVPASAQVHVTGRWTNKLATGATWLHQPVHMILTRGHNAHRNRALTPVLTA
jgi:hypothetical protein